MKKICLIVGAGAGIGGNCAKVFAKNGVFEAYGGAGFGNVGFDVGYPNNKSIFKANSMKFFLQPSIGFSNEVIDIAFSTRFVGVNFSNIDTLGYTPLQLEEENLDQVAGMHLFAEPALTTRIGYRYVKLHLQAIYAAKLSDAEINYSPLRLNIGVHIDIAKWYDK